VSQGRHAPAIVTAGNGPAQTTQEEPAGSHGGQTSLRVLVVVLCLVAAFALIPFWAPLVVAAWAAVLAAPLHRLVVKRIHRRKGAAAVVTVLLVVAFLTPLMIVTLSLSASAVELGRRLLQSGSGTEALRALAVNGGQGSFDFHQLDVRKALELARQHGASALGIAKTLFGAATAMALGGVVFASAFYTFLYEGARLHEWLLVHSPLERGQFHRISSVFSEVGRGLLIGVGLTAALQGAVATLGYVVCGVPQPLVLGLVTVFASLIPSIGSGLVWAPVTAGLFLSGRPGAAVAMLVIGCAISLVDNLMRPLLTKYGQLRMHGLLLFVSMLGGIAVFGAGGLLLGPLAVRLAIEGLAMLRQAKPESFPAG
jgi:predicted PurR-regulated permease PerM